MSLFHQTDYREILKEELSTRLSSNRQYSLRAFARDLKLSASTVSHVLSGRKGLSATSAKAIAEKLGWTQSETEYFCALVVSEGARSETQKKFAKKTVKEHHRASPEQSKALELQIDAVRVISDWYHFPILELFKTNPKLKPKTIAKRLGLQEIEVELAISRLERIELLDRTSKGILVSNEWVISKENVPSDAVKKVHQQMLDKAKTALLTQSVQERYFRTMCFPFKVKDIAKAQADLTSFFEDFLRKHSSAEGDEIYSLSTQFIRLTEPEVKS